MSWQLRTILGAICLGLMHNVNAHSLPLMANLKTRVEKPANRLGIKKLLLTHYSKEHSLDLSRASLEDKDMPAIIEFLKQHKDITALNLDGNGKLTAAGIIPLAFVTTLTKLNLARHFKLCPNNVCSGGLEAKDIALFANNKTLTSLNLQMHSIGDEGAIALAHNTTLKKLDVSSNNITDMGGVALAQNNTLHQLSLSNNDVGLLTAKALANNKATHKLNLSQTDISDQGAAALVNNENLTNLNLAANNITDIGAAALARSPTLRKLSLCGAHIGVNGAIALANNKSLVSLSLCGDPWDRSNPRIGDAGALALSYNTKIRVLDLANENISATGVAGLVANPNLRELWLGSNPKIGDGGAILLAQNPNRLTKLNLMICKLTDKGVQILATMKTLKKLDVSYNYIGDAGARALSNNKSLRVLDLEENQIHDEGAVALAQNKTLSRLDVDSNHIGDIGIIALKNNHFIKNLEIGVQSPDHDFVNTTSTNEIAKPISSVYRMNYCYRTANAIQCQTFK